jgi:hypothetical protein
MHSLCQHVHSCKQVCSSLVQSLLTLAQVGTSAQQSCKGSARTWQLAQLLNIDAQSLLALAQLQTSAQQSCIILLTLAQLLNNHAQSLQSLC